MRAVLDTNVLISALIRPDSPPGRILAHLVERESFEMILSKSLREELARALRYPKIRKRLDPAGGSIEPLLAMIETVSIPVEGKVRLSGVVADPDDDMVVAAAVEGCADHVVTGDKALLALGRFEEIRLVSPREFLDLLERR